MTLGKIHRDVVIANAFCVSKESLLGQSYEKKIFSLNRSLSGIFWLFQKLRFKRNTVWRKNENIWFGTLNETIWPNLLKLHCPCVEKRFVKKTESNQILSYKNWTGVVKTAFYVSRNYISRWSLLDKGLPFSFFSGCVPKISIDFVRTVCCVYSGNFLNYVLRKIFTVTQTGQTRYF